MSESAFDRAIEDADLTTRALIRSGREAITVYVRAEGEEPPIVDMFFGGVVIVLGSRDPAVAETIESAFAAERELREHA